jgi:ABC-2 type transport system permease protein
VNAALHAEWTKLRTTPGTGWLLLAAVVVTIGLSWLASAAVHFQTGGLQDPVKISLTGVQAGQAIVALIGVLFITGEYSSGLIRSSVAAMPQRWTMLSAKAIILTGLVLLSGTVAVLGSFLIGRFLLPGNGFDPTHGFPSLTLSDPETLRAAAGSVIYLGFIGLLSLGIATLVRDSAVAVGVVLGVLYLFPIVIQVVADPDWKQHLQQIAPTNAGLAVQSTVDLQSLAISPWLGLGVLGLWAAGAMLAAMVTLNLRDV